MLVNDKIYIGALQNNKLLYLDQPEMINFIERILTYALLRDEFREMKLKILNKLVKEQYYVDIGTCLADD